MTRISARSLSRPVASAASPAPRTRSLRLETLESRELLSATPIDPAATEEAPAVAVEVAPTPPIDPAIDLTEAVLDEGNLATVGAKETPSIVVTTALDVVDDSDGLISLREAINYASPGDAVTFADELAGETIYLELGQLKVFKAITISAEGLAGGITIDAQKNSRVMEICTGDANVGGCKLGGITITGGTASIENYYGGGIYMHDSCIELDRCSISGNFLGSGTNHLGGGIYAKNTTITLRNCLIAKNDAYYGGGIYLVGDESFVFMYNTTISGNSAARNWGGGILMQPHTGLYVCNSIIASNSGAVNTKFDDIGILEPYRHEYTIEGHNVFTSFTNWTDGAGIASTDIINSNDHLFEPLFTDATNGDYTLAEGSIAIGRGNNTYSASLTVDLAGNPRVVGKAVDLGAYEMTIVEEAPSLTVTTLNDVIDPYDGEISLREAATVYAQAGDTITFAESLSGGTIALSSELSLTQSVSIDATALAGGLTLSGNSEHRVINISGKTTSVELKGLTIANGGKDAAGAGVRVESGSLVMTNCVVSGNEAATWGGGVYVTNGTATLTNCLVVGNSAKYGGGLYATTNGTFNLYNTTVAGNTGTTRGGGIYLYVASSKLNAYNTILAGNASPDGADVRRYNANAKVNGYSMLSSWTTWNAGSANLVYDASKPLFADAAAGDYTLSKRSQALNAGNSEYVSTDLDLAGNPRVVGKSVDLGAYEMALVEEEPGIIVTTLSDVIDPYDGEISLREAATVYGEDGDVVTFDSNLAGGTISLESTLTLDRSITIDGSGVILDAGGAFGAVVIGDADVALLDLTISGGNATDGAGLYVSGNLLMQRCVIRDNTASGHGAGVYIKNGTADLSNCLVTGNTAKYGAGAYAATSGALILHNTTVAGNTGTTRSGGVYAYAATSSIAAYNSIIAENEGGDFWRYNGNAKLVAFNSLTSWKTWTRSGACLTYSAKNPLFTDSANGDYTLAANSQALDKGNTAYANYMFDLAGNFRLSGTAVDIGAYERTPDATSAVLDEAFAEFFEEDLDIEFV